LLLVTGRNGSGKSSLLRMLAGLLPVFEGAIFWRGAPIKDWDAQRARVNYIGHTDALKSALSVGETLGYWSILQGRKEKNTKKTLELFGLADLRDRSVRALSAGQKRRLALTRLGLSEAPLWLFDEPSTGLDDEGQTQLATLIESHRKAGGFAVIATHHKADFKNARHLALDQI